MCFEFSVKSTSEEMAAAKKWIAENFGSEASVLPFSFQYGGQSSDGLLKAWKTERVSNELDESRTQHTLTYADSKTGLEVRCVIVEYNDFPTVEWTLYFKNTGASDTPIVSDIQALDINIAPHSSDEGGSAFLLHHNVGSICKPNDYQPLETKLQANTSKRITAAGGRPTNSDMSYFNVESTSGDGVIVVVGWPGQWAAEFTCDESNVLNIRAGQELTHFKLYPGEEIRTPLIVLQFYEVKRCEAQFWKGGDWIDAQNVWRQWMIKHNLPRPGGELPAPLLNANSSFQFNEMVNANEDNQKLFIDRYLEAGIKLDYWWMDAGWYVNNGSWPNTGTWEVDKKRFPNGLRAVSDHAHTKGVKIIVWFEPERVTADTWLSNNHPEWLLGIPGLLDLGNPEAREWLTDHIDKLLTEQGIDLYRQDFNIDPLNFWRGNDTEDRQGITEIRHVTGYLAYWDELRRRHPDMLIDSCASGGRRNDLETLRRAVPLLRSDYRFDSEANQCHTYGMACWIPFYGTNFRVIDDYAIRSAMCLSFNARIDMREKDLDYDGLRRLIGEWRQVAKYYYGDYYPFTPYSLDEDVRKAHRRQRLSVWIAWQFDRPDLGEGMVQAFRREKSVYESARFNLRGLEPDAHYTVKNMDASDSEEMSGRELMDNGLVVNIPDQPGAVVITYEKVE